MWKYASCYFIHSRGIGYRTNISSLKINIFDVLTKRYWNLFCHTAYTIYTLHLQSLIEQVVVLKSSNNTCIKEIENSPKHSKTVKHETWNMNRINGLWTTGIECCLENWKFPAQHSEFLHAKREPLLSPLSVVYRREQRLRRSWDALLWIKRPITT